MTPPRIGILTVPISKSGVIPLAHLIEITCKISDSINLLTGNEGYTYFREDKRIKTFGFYHNDKQSLFKRVFYYILLQIKFSLLIFNLRKEIDLYLFFIGGDTLLIPIFITKILRKKTIVFIAGSSIKTLESKNDPLMYGLRILHYFVCYFSNKIIVYSENLIDDYYLKKWKSKIVIAHEHYIDHNLFFIEKEYSSRKCIVGYVGRLTKEKGILQFLHAIPYIINQKSNVEFLVIGEGSLKPEIDEFVQMNNLNLKIKFLGWISHESLPKYLNQMRLLVIPSYTEGLPNIMLEAMACGTPVLATSVGAISTIIQNRDTGYILNNNSSECIATNVLKILNDDQLNNIINNANQKMQNNFQLKNLIKTFERIIID